MYTRATAAQLASRVRSLVGDGDGDAMRAIADDLGVCEGDLREILQYETPYPSITVLAALVATYGVDAGWLLTGVYSPASHRADEECEAPARARVARLLHEIDAPADLAR